MKIEETTNYGQFKQIKGNRAVNRHQVNRLIQSIGIRNMLKYAPIIVNEKLEVIDGQHRLEAAKEMVLPIYFLEVPGANLRDVQLLNAVNRPWTLEDFLAAYTVEGLPEYLKVQDFMKRSGYSLGVALYMLTKKLTNKSGTHITAFKDGSFEVTDPEWAEEMVENLRQFSPYVRPNVWADRQYITALMIIFDKGAKLDRLLERAEKKGELLHRQVNVSEYLRELEKIYNYDMKQDIVRFF